jgi:hypothetical protein
MNTETNTTETLPYFWPKEQTGLSEAKYNSLSQDARYLYCIIYDYCTYHPDPQYQKLHQYRMQISKLDCGDRDILIEYFNHDPAIRWTGIPEEPYAYYRKDYYNS